MGLGRHYYYKRQSQSHSKTQTWPSHSYSLVSRTFVCKLHFFQLLINIAKTVHWFLIFFNALLFSASQLALRSPLSLYIYCTYHSCCRFLFKKFCLLLVKRKKNGWNLEMEKGRATTRYCNLHIVMLCSEQNEFRFVSA